MYPCQYNEVLNFVCIHPDSETEATGSDWNKGGNKASLLNVYKGFDKNVLALLSKANPETLKLWKLLDLEALSSWTKGHLALLGDAAHPFLPHQGQGGGCAIEDAASLAVVLPYGTSKQEVPERLGLYQSFRFERASRIQQYTRLAGRDKSEIGGKPVDMTEYTDYNFGYDEFDHSTKLYRQWLRARNPHKFYRMPIAFGPMPGPRQNFDGIPRNALHSTFCTASIKFRTSRTLLENLFPTDAYSFQTKSTVVSATFSATTLNKMEWLGGEGYNHVGLYIHGVQYKKRDGTVLKGTYMPIFFESLTDPIVSGREELGMPKLYCAIDINRRSNSYHLQCSWRGARFGNMTFTNLRASDPKEEHGTIGGEADDGILVYRYIPAVGERGKADAEYPVVVPHAEESKVVPSTVTDVQRPGKASFSWDGLDWDSLPTLHHVASRLAEIPVYEILGAKVVSGTGVPDVSSAKRVE